MGVPGRGAGDRRRPVGAAARLRWRRRHLRRTTPAGCGRWPPSPSMAALARLRRRPRHRAAVGPGHGASCVRSEPWSRASIVAIAALPDRGQCRSTLARVDDEQITKMVHDAEERGLSVGLGFLHALSGAVGSLRLTALGAEAVVAGAPAAAQLRRSIDHLETLVDRAKAIFATPSSQAAGVTVLADVPELARRGVRFGTDFAAVGAAARRSPTISVRLDQFSDAYGSLVGMSPIGLSSCLREGISNAVRHSEGRIVLRVSRQRTGLRYPSRTLAFR